MVRMKAEKATRNSVIKVKVCGVTSAIFGEEGREERKEIQQVSKKWEMYVGLESVVVYLLFNNGFNSIW